MAAKSGERFMLWGRENAEFLGVAFAGVAGIVVTSGKTFSTVTKLQEALRHEHEKLQEALYHEREMREKDFRHEQEMRQVPLKEAVICSQVDVAVRLEDLNFSKEYKKMAEGTVRKDSQEVI